MLHKLQYISQGKTSADHLQNIRMLADSGIKLVQLRLKNVSETEYLDIASEAKEICSGYSVQLIINDQPAIAKKVNADAVHLGLDDMKIEEARKLVPDLIIGGTANTFDHVKQRCEEKADYIGLGPFRFTTTKEKLSPVLGEEGYRRIISRMQEENRNVPVYAIGGIEANDVKGIMNTGVYGIAVSGLLTNSTAKEKLIKELIKILYNA